MPILGQPVWQTGNTGLTLFELLFLTSLILNLMFGCAMTTAFCCWCMKPGRQKTGLEQVWISRYGERAHASDQCPTIDKSVGVKKFKMCAKCFKVLSFDKVKDN